MTAVAVVKISVQQVIHVIGDPLAPNTVPAVLRNGDTIYREDTAQHYSYTEAGVVLGVGAPAMHDHDAGDIASGVIAAARLGTGTPSSTKVLLGDGTWGEGLPAVDHASDHEAGGGDALALANIAGTITAGQHGTPAGDLHPGYALDADLAAHLADADPHPLLQRESEKNAANGYAGLDAGAKVAIAQVPTGATGSTVAIGNDARLSDARTPLTHSHVAGDITGTAVLTADARLSDARTPTAHSHPQSEVTNLVSDLAAKQPLDADLTTIAGLTATTDNFMVATASAWASRTPAQAKTALALVKGDVGLGNADNTSDASKPVSTATQTALDAKAATTQKLDDFGMPDDNTDLNASTTAHGLLRKLSNVSTEFLDGTGAFSTPAGGSSSFARTFALMGA